MLSRACHWDASKISRHVNTYTITNVVTTTRHARHYTVATSSLKSYRKCPTKHPRQCIGGTASDYIRGHRHASTASQHPVNPPTSTLPPALSQPTRGKENYAWYLWRIAQAYGSFYKSGVKAILANRKEANRVIERLQKETKIDNYNTVLDVGYNFLLTEAVKRSIVSRADYQLIHRHAHDIRRVPIFGVLVLLLGEWLPLIVPFAPSLPPLTCQIPSQTTAMRQGIEERRRMSFRKGIRAPQAVGPDPEGSKPVQQWQMSDRAYNHSLIRSFSNEAIYHLSCVLNLHGRIWERLNMTPPSAMLKPRIARRLQYITQDDLLLLRGGGIKSLSADETKIACEERGISVVGPPVNELKSILDRWVKAQQKEHGRGSAVLEMLFKRPNAWTTIK